MTERLYYTDAYLTVFTGRVLTCRPRGEHFDVVLDRTAFYPTSGGQPCDRGTLGDAQVIEVVDDEALGVRHVVDRAVTEGTEVAGHIEWRRRFDHMQQHTGQHVLSAAFDRLFGVRTESFHLGTTSATIDLAREVSPAEIRDAEDEANRVVWEDRPVAVRVASSEEAKALPLRKESLREGPLRLIEVDAFDLSACGGTHVARTGAIGVIAVAGWERFRGATRVEFVCGGRALQRFRDWREALAAAGRHLSGPPSELAAGIERLQHESRTLQKLARTQQEQLAVHEAAALVARAERVGGRAVVVEALEGWDASGLKSLAAAAIARDPHAAVALFLAATPPLAVIAAGRASGVDAAGVLKALTARFGGKGGGRPELAQGGGFNAPLDDLLAAARALVGGGPPAA